MTEYRRLVEEARQLSNGVEIMEKWITILEHMFDSLEDANEDLYNKTMEEMYVSVYGYHFNARTATHAVGLMSPTQPTLVGGEHWTVDECEAVAKQHGIVFDKFNKYDWYWTMNMIYNDYGGLVVPVEDLNTMVKMAHAFISDSDAPKGKAYRYYKAMMCEDD